MFGARKQVVLGGDSFRDEYSLAFDGTNDYIDLGTNFESTVFNSAFSISVWVKTDDGQGNDEYILGTKDGDDSIWLEIETLGTIQFYYKEGSAEANLAASAYFANGESDWVHLVVTLSDSTQVIYANGVAVATEPNSITTSGFAQDTNRNLVIGARNNAGTISDNFSGKISDVAIYTKALSSSEVKTIYNGREPYNHKEGIASGNLQGWWRMGDGDLDTFDSSGDASYNTGLISDIVNPYTIGAELLTNGTFDSDSNWTKGAAWSIGSGLAIRASGETSDSSLVYSGSDAVTSGNIYRYSFQFQATVGSFSASLGGVTIDDSFNANNIISGYILATSGVELTITAIGSAQGIIDNCSVKLVSGGNTGVMYNMSVADFVGDTP